MTMEENNNKRIIEEAALRVVKDYMKSQSFTDRKIADLPTEANSMTPRRFITLNGVTASRPLGSVLGQRYFDTTIGRPVYWNGSTWVDGAGSVS